MATRIEAIIEPELLVWARTSASMAVDVAAKKAHVPGELLEKWEAGSERPTVNQLRLLAEAYKRPLAVFYLPKPPKTFDALHDFRRLTPQTTGQSPALAYEIRRANERREIALDLLDELREETAPPVFKARKTDDPNAVAATLRDMLGITLNQQVEWPTENVAFSKWRESVENLGVLVFQTTGVKVAEARGFSIAATPLPVIAVNGKDSYAGRIFTMMHELTHIVLRQGGVCDLDEHGLEVFCNAVAGSLLVPADALLTHQDVVTMKATEWPEESLKRLARTFRASREVIMRRLLTLGKTNVSFYERKRKQYAAELGESPAKGGPPPPVLAVARAGRLFTSVVVRSYTEGRITSADASDYLSLRLRHLPDVMKSLRLGLTA